MPFSLKMSQDIFQIWMDQLTKRLPSITAIYSDICIFGSPPRRPSEFTKINNDSRIQWPCFQQQEMHHLAAPNHLSSCSFHSAWHENKPGKSTSITTLPSTHQTKGITMFRLNYLQPFIPDLSNKMAFLRARITHWD